MARDGSNSPKTTSVMEASGEFPVHNGHLIPSPSDRFRVLVVADEGSDAVHVRDLALRCTSLRDDVHCAASWDDARARLARALDDVCVLLRPKGSRAAVELLRDSARHRWSVPIVVVTRAEEPVAERLAMSLGASDWVVRARLTSEDLERIVRNTVGRALLTDQLRERERKFRAAFDGSAEARLLVDDLGRCIDANAVARQAFSLPPGDLDGVEVATLLGPEAQRAFHAIWLARASRDEVSTTLGVRTPAGVFVTYEVEVVARILPECHLVVLRDVTARQRFAITERMLSLGTLASGLAHEINNPLQVLYTGLDMLQLQVERLRSTCDATALAEMSQELVNARGASERVRRVVHDLAVFTRTGDELERVNVVATLETALRLTGNTIRHRATLVRDLHASPAVMGNEALLTQVFVHLLLNAAQAIPEGSAAQAEVKVSLRVVDDRVHLAVADTGCGMSPEVLGRVFDPFFTTRPVGEGTGLGLSVCHGTITAMGGEISAESEPGRGSVFRMVLPSAGPVTRPSATTPVPGFEDVPRCLVMVIDDDPMVCRSLTRLLQAHHDVEALTSARDALTRIRSGERFDAIVCDVMMPEMSGVELHQELAAHVPDQAARVVFVTGGVFSPEARAFLEEGRHRVVEKPVTQAALFKALRRVLPDDKRA